MLSYGNLQVYTVLVSPPDDSQLLNPAASTASEQVVLTSFKIAWRAGRSAVISQAIILL